MATALACPPELDLKTLLVSTSHTLDTGHGNFKLLLTWKLLFCWLDCINTEVAVQASERRKKGQGHLWSFLVVNYGSYSNIWPDKVYS